LNSLNVIPQVFYDLIARILPGAIIIACAIFIGVVPDQLVQFFKTDIEKHFLASFLLYVIFSYLVAIVLMGLWPHFLNIYTCIFQRKVKKNKQQQNKKKIVGDRNWRIAKIKLVKTSRLKKIKELLGLRDKNLVIGEIPDDLLFMCDFIRKINPEIGARLDKLRAEIHMCMVLIVGFILIIILYTLCIIANYIKYKQLLGVDIFFDLVFIVMGFAIFRCMNTELYVHYYNGIFNYFFILQSSSEKQNDSSKQNEKVNIKT
jgi:hypothetical protein